MQIVVSHYRSNTDLSPSYVIYIHASLKNNNFPGMLNQAFNTF